MPAWAQNYQITLSGNFGGTELIRISQTAATLEHVRQPYPTPPVNFNGTPWDPETNPSLSLASPVTPANLSAYQVRLQINAGRDIAGAWIEGNELVLLIADTAGGESYYDLTVQLTPNPIAPSPHVAMFDIEGEFDGSDRIRLTPNRATWTHQYQSNPSNVSVGGKPWDLGSTSEFPNSGDTMYLSPAADLRTAKLIQHFGRDPVGIDVQDTYTDILFSDNPGGRVYYKVSILVTFPPSSPDPQLSIEENTGLYDLRFFTETSRSYQLQWAPTLPPPSGWINLGPVMSGTGSPKTLSIIPASGSAAFFQLSISNAP